MFYLLYCKREGWASLRDMWHYHHTYYLLKSNNSRFICARAQSKSHIWKCVIRIWLLKTFYENVSSTVTTYEVTIFFRVKNKPWTFRNLVCHKFLPNNIAESLLGWWVESGAESVLLPPSDRPDSVVAVQWSSPVTSPCPGLLTCDHQTSQPAQAVPGHSGHSAETRQTTIDVTT